MLQSNLILANFCIITSCLLLFSVANPEAGKDVDENVDLTLTTMMMMIIFLLLLGYYYYY